ncbi:delta-60 repeat domain-containing protein, partial [Akkermansiaceae bacterium]|nr:delta-60 repeat domain-containing protein [Akkermansiaceae bacterium]
MSGNEGPGNESVISPRSLDGGFAIADTVSLDPPVWRIRKFDENGIEEGTSLEFEMSSYLRKIVALPNGAYLIDGFFEQLSDFPERIFYRLHVSSDGTITPVLPSEWTGASAMFPLPHVDEVGSQYFIARIQGSEPPFERKMVLKRANALGELDDSFLAEFTDSRKLDPRVYWVLTCPDGKILVAGIFSHCNGEIYPYAVRLNHDGTIDSSYQPNLDPGIASSHGGGSSAMIQADGSLAYWGFDRDEYTLIRLRGD